MHPDPLSDEDRMARPFSAEDSPARPNLAEPAEWLRQYGDALYCYALDRLRRPHEAEEAVQETLLAALKARGQFQGRSHPRTWLMGILKRKVVDQLRAAARAAPEGGPDERYGWIAASRRWRRPPRDWGGPAVR